MTIRDARKKGYELLTQEDLFHKTQSPFLDIDLFLGNLLRVDKAYLIAHDDEEIHTDVWVNFESMITKRQKGLPVAYILGEKEFWGLNFYVNDSVLIPKYDTEILVEQALLYAQETLETTGTLSFLDLCCGSGCVGIAILHSLTREKLQEPEKKQIAVHCTAADISPEALGVAKKNYTTLMYPFEAGILENQISKARLIQSDLFSSSEFSHKQFDLIVTNPPYVPSSITGDLLSDGRSEPRLALDGGEQGLDIIERLINAAPAFLKKGGVILLETGEYNAFETADLLRSSGFSDIEHVKDLAGQNRVVKAKKN